MRDDGRSALLPTAEQTLFLRACLCDGPAGNEAWQAWMRGATADGIPLRRALASVNAFLPLLAWNLRRNRVPLDREVTTHLRSAHLTEELRLRGYQQVCASTFRVLAEASVPFVVLKGAALAEIVYPAPVLRHADDIDLLLHDDDLERGAHVLARAGWRRSDPPVLPSALHLPPLVHGTGVAVELHHRLLVPYYRLPYGAIWARSQVVQLAGAPARVLSAADNLVHVCAHAMSGLGILRWVPDVWFLLQRNPQLDWDVVTASAAIGRLSLPLSIALGYARDEMAMPIPPSALDDLRRGARATGYLGRLVARPWPERSPASIWSDPAPWWRRLALILRRAFPPPVQFAVQYDLRPWTLPFYYACRLIRYARSAVFARPSDGQAARRRATRRW